ncbi:hypothetical protein FJZ31_18320 [Candidatus Poribacteria bacterium]|nr:hypothetical protein [Candidatus Poribacteria bacterium]
MMQTVDAKQLKALIEEYRQAGIPTHDLEAQLQQMEAGALQMENVTLEVQEEDLGNGKKRVRFSFAPTDPDIERLIQARPLVRKKR